MTLDAIKSTLFTNWHLVRILRLVFGVFVLVQAVTTRDTLAGMISVLFLYQAFTNTGCCGASGCAVPNISTEKNQKIEDVEYEEIKSSTPSTRK
jgi:hypothetical protein